MEVTVFHSNFDSFSVLLSDVTNFVESSTYVKKTIYSVLKKKSE